MVVLHYTAMKSCEAALSRLCDPKSGVSAHYVISQSGVVHALVDEAMRAWHAGAGAWGMVRDLNSHSIGIELANAGPAAGFPPFPDAQMSALEGLLQGICARWSIEAKNVIAHSDLAPTRKVDPGPKFDWHRLALSGLSIWPQTNASKAESCVFATESTTESTAMSATMSAAEFLRLAKVFGYVWPEPQNDADPLEGILAAFRLRFAPGRRGALDAKDMLALADLAARFPHQKY